MRANFTMKISRIISVLLVLALVALFIAAYHAKHHPSVAKKPTHPVLVVDLHNNGLVMLEDLNKGEDALLVVQPQSNDKANEQWISSFDVLERFDVNHDRRIDKKDPIYSRLALLYYPGDATKKKYVSLEKAGIKAIVFGKEELEKLPKSMEEAHHIVAGYVEMADGTTRKISVLPVGY